MLQKLALFPMTRDMCAVARNQSILRGYSLTQLLVPGFTMLAGEDISRIDGGSFANVRLAKYGADALVDCDVLFVDYDENMQVISMYNDVIQTAKEMGKDVVFSRKLRSQLREKNISQSNNVPLLSNSDFDYLYEINVPVITVLSQGPRTDQFALELALRNHFSNEGYKVAQVGSYEASSFFGFSDLPDFLHEPFDAYEKILKFNHYVKELIDNEKPDLLILGISGAIMKYNDRLLNGLGVLPFIACSAVRSDLQILSMYRDNYKNVYFDEMFNYGAYRLSAPIRFFNISNTCLVPEMSSDIPKRKYIDLTSNFVLENIHCDVQDGEYHIFNVLNHDSANGAFIAAQELLTGNTRVL